jgi:hypothetical protein
MAHDVFISHSAKDKQVADALCAALESERIRCWLAPRDVPPGAEWASEIVRAVEGSTVMVLIFSENAADSAHVRREITAAANAEITIVPLKIDGTSPSGAMEYYLADTHWLDALNPPTADQIATVVRRVAGLLQREFDAERLVVPLAGKPARRPIWLVAAAAVLALALIGGGAYAAVRFLGRGSNGASPQAAGDSGTQAGDASSISTSGALPSGTGEVVPYDEVVAALPEPTPPVGLEAQINSTLEGDGYLWLEFTGRWEDHDIKGSVQFSGTVFDYLTIDRFDALVIPTGDEAALQTALENADLKRFYETVAYAPAGAKITALYPFKIESMTVARGDTLTFDKDLRLVKTTW